jgi:hypothetical protein
VLLQGQHFIISTATWKEQGCSTDQHTTVFDVVYVGSSLAGFGGFVLLYCILDPERRIERGGGGCG